MLTLTDLFAGFGGASSGAVAVPGIELSMAANHWPLAVEVHNMNHEQAVRGYGAAVTPPNSRDLMSAVAETLAGAA